MVLSRFISTERKAVKKKTKKPTPKPDKTYTNIEAVRAYLRKDITTGKLLELVPSTWDLIGCFANCWDEERQRTDQVACSILWELRNDITRIESFLSFLRK
jgi:hypothetical protein